MGDGLLMVVSGPSGAGKSTVCKRLLEKHPEIALSVSVTTRAPRNAEQEGINYFFRTHQEFERMLLSDELLEHAHVYGNDYGTPRRYVEEKLAGGVDVLLEIEMQGALQVKKRFECGIFVFVVPPTIPELKNRIMGRGSETPESLQERFQSAYSELGYLDEYDYLVVNDDVEHAVETIEAIMTAEKARVSRCGAFRMDLLEQGRQSDLL